MAVRRAESGVWRKDAKRKRTCVDILSFFYKNWHLPYLSTHTFQCTRLPCSLLFGRKEPTDDTGPVAHAPTQLVQYEAVPLQAELDSCTNKRGAPILSTGDERPLPARLRRHGLLMCTSHAALVNCLTDGECSLVFDNIDTAQILLRSGARYLRRRL
jgi:hypothetical protein